MARNPDMTAPKRAPSAKPKRSPAAASPPPVLRVPAPAPAAPAETEKQAVGENHKAPVGAKGLLRAGLKALGEVRDDVVVRQSRIFEALLGIDTSALLPRGIDPAKNQLSADARFEDVFDQRVARSLERLGMPSPQALTALCRQLEAINEHLQRDHAPPPAKPAPRKRRPASKKP